MKFMHVCLSFMFDKNPFVYFSTMNYRLGYMTISFP